MRGEIGGGRGGGGGGAGAGGRGGDRDRDRNDPVKRAPGKRYEKLHREEFAKLHPRAERAPREVETPAPAGLELSNSALEALAEGERRARSGAEAQQAADSEHTRKQLGGGGDSPPAAPRAGPDTPSFPAVVRPALAAAPAPPAPPARARSRWLPPR